MCSIVRALFLHFIELVVLSGSPESVMWSRLSSGSLSPAVCAPLLLPSIATIVGHYSRTQSIKGIFTAGASKSVVYAGRKLAKMFK